MWEAVWDYDEKVLEERCLRERDHVGKGSLKR